MSLPVDRGPRVHSRRSPSRRSADGPKNTAHEAVGKAWSWSRRGQLVRDVRERRLHDRFTSSAIATDDSDGHVLALRRLRDGVAEGPGSSGLERPRRGRRPSTISTVGRSSIWFTRSAIDCLRRIPSSGDEFVAENHTIRITWRRPRRRAGIRGAEGHVREIGLILRR